MLYYYFDTLFQGKSIRFLKFEPPHQEADAKSIEVLRIVQQKHPDMLVLIKEDGRVFHTTMSKEQRELWEAYTQEFPLMYDENYDWESAEVIE